MQFCWYFFCLVFSELPRFVILCLSLILYYSQPQYLLQIFLVSFSAFSLSGVPVCVCYFCVIFPEFHFFNYFFLFVFQFGDFVLTCLQVHWFFFSYLCPVYWWVHLSKLFFNWSIINIQYYLSFRCITYWFHNLIRCHIRVLFWCLLFLFRLWFVLGGFLLFCFVLLPVSLPCNIFVKSWISYIR